ncbi:MAG: Hsp33 family molecular chaperone HslO [Betaproteobacteria bacterium]|nr:Hsp33 family molecular chaperone HslO [Betaproteobacteria bacterium]
MDAGPDSLSRFLLRGAPVRGEIVSLDAAWRTVVERHALPACVRNCLGELSAAALLLAASLKFDGMLVLQIHGDGPVALLVVECDAGGGFRATVKIREGAVVPEEARLTDLVNADGRGRFVVTLDPRTRSPSRQPYQGIVPFEGDSVAQVLEHYMGRSEQVPTRLWLAADDSRATGLLLQRLPEEGGRAAPSDADGWNRLCRLADTLRSPELLELPASQVLHRLFWQEPLHGFDQRACRFSCSCSRDKVASMLRLLGEAEVASILTERGSVAVRCEFCNLGYGFDAVDCAALFAGAEPHSAPGQSQ